jgi:hypothetical protein
MASSSARYSSIAGFSRAFSPYASAFSAEIAASRGLDSSEPAVARKEARLRVITSTTSVEDVLALVPRHYADVLRAPLLGYSDLHHKLLKAVASHMMWQKHFAAGTFPPFLAGKGGAPKTPQMSKEFLESAEGKTTVEERRAADEAARVAHFRGVIADRVKEIDFLKGKLDHPAQYAVLAAIAKEVRDHLATQRRLPQFADVLDDKGEVTGEIQVVDWSSDPFVDTEYKEVLEDLSVWMWRIKALVDDKWERDNKRTIKKKSLQHDADVTMADAEPTAGPSTSTIAKMVASEVAKQSGGSKASKSKKDKKKVRSNYKSSYSVIYDYFSGQAGEEGEILNVKWGASALPKGNLSLIGTETVTYSSLEQALHQGFRRTSTRQEGQGQQEGWQEAASLMDKYVYGRPSTIPDFLLSVPRPIAIQFLICNTPVNVLLESQYRSYIHTSPGVNLPSEIAFQLSVGMKFMYYRPMKRQLIESAWKDFNRRLHWRLKFSFEASQKDSIYDPDFDVHQPPSGKMPVLPQYLELGLLKGRAYVYQQLRLVDSLPDKALMDGFNPLVPSNQQIQSWLADNDCIVTATDKNLGLAVSKREWIIEKSLDILNNVKDYREISYAECINILDDKVTRIKPLAKLAREWCDPFEGTVADFLRSKIPVGNEVHAVPKFYGLPKIHKQPVKFRPIIPCHSVVMNPCAKYVSKKLKPLIKEAPTVIHGSKDLAIKLSKLNINPRRKWYIVSGDVVAFYPNIPLDKCMQVVRDMYADHLFHKEGFVDNEISRKQFEVFCRALEIGNTSLVTTFQNKYYLQLNGLAMGVADSPDLANLYGCYFENKSNVLNNDQCIYYGRYIDDCLGLCYAESEEEALHFFQSKIVFDGCVIEWSVSDSSSVFLDMLLYKENNTLQHMPYRKKGNHQERIPWISYHPLDVKRGTFIGEMSRLATLCSLHEHYRESMQGLVALYVKRGYPEQVVKRWLKDNFKERWEKRLVIKDDAGERPDVLVLKSEFNPVWNYFSAKELENTIFGYWREWLDRADRRAFNGEFPNPLTSLDEDSGWCSIGDVMEPDPDLATSLFPGAAATTNEYWMRYLDLRKTDILNRKIIVSRKRTRNLFDLSSLWKKVVFEQLEALVGEDTSNELSGQPRETSRVHQLNPINHSTTTSAPIYVGVVRPRDQDDGSVSSDDDHYSRHRRRRASPSAPRAWISGAMR